LQQRFYRIRNFESDKSVSPDVLGGDDDATPFFLQLKVLNPRGQSVAPAQSSQEKGRGEEGRGKGEQKGKKGGIRPR
jgi:hypothetical protein